MENHVTSGFAMLTVLNTREAVGELELLMGDYGSADERQPCGVSAMQHGRRCPHLGPGNPCARAAGPVDVGQVHLALG